MQVEVVIEAEVDKEAEIGVMVKIEKEIEIMVPSAEKLRALRALGNYSKNVLVKVYVVDRNPILDHQFLNLSNLFLKKKK